MKTLIIALILICVFPAYAAKRMITPEICSNNIDDDHNGTADDGCPFSSVFSAITNGIAADMKDARMAGTIATATDAASSSGTFLKNTGTYRTGQWALNGNHTGTVYPWMKVRVPTTGNQSDNRVWLATTPFTQSSQNAAMSIVSNVSLPPPPSFGWVKLSGSFAFTGDFILYGLNTSRVEIDCIALVTSNSTDPVTANPECVAGAPVSGIAFDAAGTPASDSAVSSLQVTITVGSGSDRHLRCNVAHRTETNTITGVSSNVDGALSLFSWTHNDSVGNGWYYLSNPTTGAHTITASFSEAQNAAMGCDSWSGVHQTSPYGAVQTATGTGTPLLQLAGAGDQIALDHLSLSQEPVDTVTVGSGQTERWQKNISGVTDTTGRTSVASSKQGDSSVTMTMTMADLKAWSYQAAMLRPPSAAGQAPVVGTPSATLVGVTTATVEATVDDASATCQAEYEQSGGTAPPYTSNTSTIGTSGNKCVHNLSGLTANTSYVFRINATNANGTTNSSQGTFTTSAGGSASVTALGITQAEINAWNTRRTSGPYRVAGDVSTNSPGDWTRILGNANALVSSPTSDRWNGTGFSKSGSCNIPGNEPGPGSDRSLGDRTRDAAFVHLLTGTTSYLTVAKANLLYEAGLSTLNFADSSQWCVGQLWDINPFFDVAHWLVKLLFAYDYIRPSLANSGPNQDLSAVSTLDTWFLNMGVFWEAVVDEQTYWLYANSRQNNLTTFTLSGNGSSYSTTLGVRTYCGGPFDNNLSGKYQNRMASFVKLFGQIGVLLNKVGVSPTTTARLKTMGKRYVMEYLQFAIMPDGTPLEFERNISDGIPNGAQHGWRYSADTAGSIGMVADALARAGDTSLYTYTTSNGAGSGSNSTAGGSKTLALVHEQLARYVNQSETGAPRYAKDSTTLCSSGGSNTLIGPQLNTSNGEASNRDTFLAQANLFYQNAVTKSMYLRTATSAPAYPSSPEGGGYCVWCGPSGEFPGVLFMFGQMEGVVYPY